MNLGDTVKIRGCSLKSKFLETSTGNDALDAILGGQIGVSSSICIDEICSRIYAETMAKYFISEGLHNGHDIVVAGANAKRLMDCLPSRIENDLQSLTNQGDQPYMDADMKIAWRYGATAKVNSSIGHQNRYDLGKPLNNFSKFSSRLTIFPSSDSKYFYMELLFLLQDLLSSEEFNKERSPSGNNNLLRVIILGIGSPLWGDSEHFSMFLARLQMLTREKNVVVFKTTCSNHLSQKHLGEIEASSDIFIRLKTMTDDERKLLPGNDKADGFLEIVKLSRLTSVTCFCPSAVDLVYELHRRSFLVKVLHLPPAIGDSPTQNAKAESKPNISCGVDF